MKTYNVKLTGVTPLLMHRDNHSFGVSLKSWQTNPENKARSIPGDDRTPGWSWIGSVYHDDKVLGVPSDNLMTMLREGGAKVPTGKGQGTYKRQTQSGLIVMETIWPLKNAAGDTIPWAPIKEISTEENFDAHVEAVQKLGFDLMVKRAKIGQSKHVRVRPIFAAGWTVEGTLTVVDTTITEKVLSMILTCAGLYCGLGDWRPSAPKSPGPFGRFEAEID